MAGVDPRYEYEQHMRRKIAKVSRENEECLFGARRQ
jgi:hypothetical protein